MPDVTVPLSDAQARTLSRRARTTQRPSDEILRDIVTTALDEDDGDIDELDEAAVDRAFADFADAYPALSEALFASDPDLGSDYHDDDDTARPAEAAQQDAEVPIAPADSSAVVSDDEYGAGPPLTSVDVDQAFGILADQYEEIAEGLFGSEESRSTDHLESQGIPSAFVEFRRNSPLFLLTKYLPVGSPAVDASSVTDDLTNHIYLQLQGDRDSPSGIVVLISRDHLAEIARLPKA